MGNLEQNLLNTSFGKKLKEYRELRGYSQAKMALMIPMPQSSFSKIECDLQEPNLMQLKRMAEILKFSIDEILNVTNSQDINYTKEKSMLKFIREFYAKQM